MDKKRALFAFAALGLLLGGVAVASAGSHLVNGTLSNVTGALGPDGQGCHEYEDAADAGNETAEPEADDGPDDCSDDGEKDDDVEARDD